MIIAVKSRAIHFPNLIIRLCEEAELVVNPSAAHPYMLLKNSRICIVMSGLFRQPFHTHHQILIQIKFCLRNLINSLLFHETCYYFINITVMRTLPLEFIKSLPSFTEWFTCLLLKIWNFSFKLVCSAQWEGILCIRITIPFFTYPVVKSVSVEE